MDHTFKVKYRRSGSSKWKDTTMTIHGTYAECPECKQNLVDPIQFNVLQEIRINNISDQKVKAKQAKDRSFGLKCGGEVFHFTSVQRNEILLDILSHCPQNKINHEHLKTIQSSTGIQIMEIDQDGDCEYDHVMRVSHDENQMEAERKHIAEQREILKAQQNRLENERMEFQIQKSIERATLKKELSQIEAERDKWKAETAEYRQMIHIQKQQMEREYRMFQRRMKELEADGKRWRTAYIRMKTNCEKMRNDNAVYGVQETLQELEMSRQSDRWRLHNEWSFPLREREESNDTNELIAIIDAELQRDV